MVESQFKCVEFGRHYAAGNALTTVGSIVKEVRIYVLIDESNDVA